MPLNRILFRILFIDVNLAFHRKSILLFHFFLHSIVVLDNGREISFRQWS